MVKHGVIFRFNNSADQAEKEIFLQAADDLKKIPGVRNLEVLRQVSKKNNFEYGIFMEFSTETAYQSYNEHPLHQQFITKYWIPNIQEFLEIDLKPLDH